MHLTAGRDTNHDRNGSHRLNALKRERFHVSGTFLNFQYSTTSKKMQENRRTDEEKSKNEDEINALFG